MADGYTTMYDILKNPLSVRRERYGTTDISHIVIDGNKFGGYKAFSSFWEKTYVKQPERSQSGVIDNLDSYPTFVTFHVKVDFAMLSIDDYRRLYDLILSRNEFIVTAYNILDNKTHTCKMYFAPDQMPKIYTVARKLQGQGEPNKFIEVLGVQDYTIELIGTNAQLGDLTITYNPNIPSNTSSSLTGVTINVADGQEILVGTSAENIMNAELVDTSGTTWVFKKWNTVKTPTEEKKGVNYAKGQSLYVNYNITLYAQWETNDTYTLSYNYGVGEPQKDSYGNAIYSKQIKIEDTFGELYSSKFPSVTFQGSLYYPYIRKGWYRTPQIGVDENGEKVLSLKETDIYGVKGNSTIYQIFLPQSYTLTFNTKGGNEIEKITAPYDSTVAIPIPKKDGKTFKGWYYDEKYEKPFGGKMPPINSTLYAKWE